MALGGANLEGKILFLNWFLVVPLGNLTYWLLVWGRRRTLSLYTKPPPANAGQLGAPLAPPGAGPVARRAAFEYAADWRDLHLDGRHWRAQFGGSSGRSAKMGAYICCDFRLYVLVRLLIAAAAVAFLGVRLWVFLSANDDNPNANMATPFLYFEQWVCCLAVLYFSLAAGATAVAACSRGAQEASTPLAVWLISGCYGALLPASIVSMLIFAIVTHGRYSLPLEQASHVLATAGTCALVLLDAWINRQPYYAAFHSLFGVAFCWGYLIFNVAYVLAGGES